MMDKQLRSVQCWFALALAPAVIVAGCTSSSGGDGTTPPVVPSASPTPGGPKIQHAVILIQENRTVDNLFNGYPGADTVAQGFGQDPVAPSSRNVGVPISGTYPRHITQWPSLNILMP